LSCFTGAATATGACLKYRWGDVIYAAMRNNLTLARLFKQNMESLGRRVKLVDPDSAFGSTDMGNVSQLVPSIHPEVAIAPEDVIAHSPEFALAAASETGSRGLLDAAKAMAMTVVDLVSSPEVVSKIKDEFRRGIEDKIGGES
jgi:metal-dependent amidase/aminoacylase/carboxypeptidase family protein